MSMDSEEKLAAGYESGERKAQEVFDHILDIIESLEFENLESLQRIAELEEKVRRLQEEKIILARKVETNEHRAPTEAKGDGG